MTDYMFLLTICLFLGTVLAVFGIRAISAILQARARLANDGAYRDLAERAATAQSGIDTALAGVHARLGAIEKILKDVG